LWLHIPKVPYQHCYFESAQNVPLQRVWDLIAQKCKLLYSGAVLLLSFVANGILRIFVRFHGIVESE
jgi:hypothetical protein